MVCVAKNCSVYNCENRHPKTCTFQRDHGRCKYTTFCKYDHKKPKDVLENTDKIAELEAKVKEMEKDNGKTKVSNTDIEIQVEKKVDALERQVKHLRKALEGKDFVILNLDKRLKVMENNFEEATLLIKDLETKMELVAKITEQLYFKCSECDFSTISEQGLKTHKKRKHKHKSDEMLTYPKQCDLCEKDLKDKNDIKVHMKKH